MSQRAFFSTAGSEIMGQSQILDGLPAANIVPAISSGHFQPSGSASVLYQSTATPTYYSSTASLFHGAGTFLPPSVDEQRKDYVTVLPAGVQISDASGLIPVNGRGTLASVGTGESSSSVAQLTPVALSQIATLPSDTQTSNSSFLYEHHYYVDHQHPSTSSAADGNSLVQPPTSNPNQATEDAKQMWCYGETASKSSSMRDSPTVSESELTALQVKRQRQADAARLRYQRMSAEEKREVNAKRTAAQKRKRQKDKEMEELEMLLRASKDIEDDPQINEQLREQRNRARRAQAARLRYQRMSSEERRIYNQRRRNRQLGITGPKKDGLDDEKLKQHIIEQNAKKAEAARLRYHRMTDEEKKLYNQRRTEAFRRRRLEEEILLSTPAGRISSEALHKAQAIMMRNARRAEAARLRYQRMTPEQRRAYNQRRSRAKKAREQANRAASAGAVSIASVGSDETSVQLNSSGNSGNNDRQQGVISNVCEEVLSDLEREVIRRTRQANMALMRQKRLSPHEQYIIISSNPDGTQTVIPAASTTADGKQIFHIPVTTLEDGKQVLHIPNFPAMTQQVITAGNGLTIIEEKPASVQQLEMQLAASPQMMTLHPQHVDLGETMGHQIAVADSRTVPQLAELQNVQIVSDIKRKEQLDAQMEARLRAQVQTEEAHARAQRRNESLQQQQLQQLHSHQQQQQQSEQSEQQVVEEEQAQQIIVTVNESQQTGQHQIIVTDLNQPTGAVLTSIGSHSRARGRPPIYAAAAAALQQQHQGNLSLQGQITVATTQQSSITTGKSSSQATASFGTVAPRADILAVATAASVGTKGDLTPQQKLELQKARRAERARLRYHKMSPEERRIFNARRASALRKTRMKDEELCQLYESAQANGTVLDETTMKEIENARRRRAKRAEQARLKYHRMSSEERRQYNAMRDAQRRHRKREKELEKQEQQQREAEMNASVHDQISNPGNVAEQSIMYGSYIRYDDQLIQNWVVQS